MDHPQTADQQSADSRRRQEQAKWDQYYANLPEVGQAETASAFEAELVTAVTAFLPAGSRVLEAGAGGGLQSLALARTGRYDLHLLDFSAEALAYAQRLFASAQISAEFIQADILTPGERAYDLVFNAGVLEHYPFDEQVALLRGMASRSRGHVLALVPNRLCYWYWLWRVQTAAKGQWPFGKEVPMTDLSAAFAAAGLKVLGHAFMGEAWAESFINNLDGLDKRLRDEIFAIHRSGLIPKAQTSYLTAVLGGVRPEMPAPTEFWAPSPLAEHVPTAETLAALADALALRLGAESQLTQLHERVTELQLSTYKLQAQVDDSDRTVSDLTSRLNQSAADVSRLSEALNQSSAELTLLQRDREASARRLEEQILLNKTIPDLQAQLDDRERRLRNLQLEIERIHASQLWQLGMRYWRLRYHTGRGLRWLNRRTGLGQWLPASMKTRLRQLASPTLGPKPSLPKPLDELPAPLEDDDQSAAVRLGFYEVVCLPIIPWQLRFQRPQQLLTRFAESGHPSFYLDPNALEHSSCPSVDQLQIGVERLARNLRLVQVPGHTSTSIYTDLLEGENLEYLFRGMQLLRERYDIVDGVCLVQLPFWAPLAFRLREAFGWKIIYDCMDEHGGFTNTGEAMLAQEDRLMRESDLVLATSQLLFAKAQPVAPRSLLVPNATDFDHFNRRPAERPLKGQRRPVIGYYGAISEWFDMDLIRAAAKAHPEWSFVLIGSTVGADDYSEVKRLPNVQFLGEKAYSSLPGYLHGFDVCCIPFKLNALTNATNPVKFFEYVSAGKPVVSVRLPELLPYESQAYLADGADDFVRKLEQALQEDSPERQQARMELARRNTWAMRQASIDQAIVELYPRVSIVIVTWNNLPLTEQCVASLLAHTLYPNFEIILVDNASEDGTPGYLQALAQQHPDLVTVILNDENRGFARANNQGVAAASGAYIVFLNNDVVVSRGWLPRLLHYARRPEVGAVGPVTNHCGNEARIPVPYQSLDDMPAYARQRAMAHAGQHFEINVLALFCLCIERRKLDEVGLLDERFGIGMFEDDDFSFRIRQQGYKLVCAEDIFIHHSGSASFKRLDQAEYRRLFEQNQKLFETKWQMPWLKHWGREVPVRERLERILATHSDRLGIVVMLPGADWGDGTQLPQRIAQALSDRGYLVFYCTTNQSLDRIDGFVRVGRQAYVCHVPSELFQPVPDLILFLATPVSRSELMQFERPARLIYLVPSDIDAVIANSEEKQADHDSLLWRADCVLAEDDALLDRVQATRADVNRCAKQLGLDSILLANGAAAQLNNNVEGDRPHMEFVDDPQPLSAARTGREVIAKQVSASPVSPPAFYTNPIHAAVPLFLIGCPRSGTTLLANILNAHPSIIVTNETAVFLQLDHNIKNSLRGVKAGLLYGKEHHRLWAAHLQEQARGIIESYYGKIAEVLKKQEVKYWGDKHPHHNECLDFITSLYPAARYIYIVRDPRDVACSIAEMNHISFALAMKMWQHCSSTYEDFVANCEPGQVFLLRYEDLAQNYEQWSRSLCDWLHLPYDVAVQRYLNKYRHVDAHAILAPEPVILNFLSKSIGRWQRELNDADKEAGSATAGEYLLKYGYG